MQYLSEILTGVFVLFSGVGGLVLSRWWWVTHKFRLKWLAFPPVSMMAIHDDVVKKLEVAYNGHTVSNLTKRRFLLCNVGYRAIKDETLPLQWQAPGPILGCSTSPTDGQSWVNVSINSENKRRIDIHWEAYLNSGHREYVDVLYDKHEKLDSVELLGARLDTIILSKCAPSDYEQRSVTRERIGWSAIGGGIAGLAVYAVSIVNSEAFPPSFGPLVAYVVMIVGTILAFVRARIEYNETARSGKLPEPPGPESRRK